MLMNTASGHQPVAAGPVVDFSVEASCFRIEGFKLAYQGEPALKDI